MLKITTSVLVMLALCAVTAFGADSEGKKITKLESTILNNETILKYESYDAGMISGSLDVKFVAMVITDPVKSDVVASGMKIIIIGDKNVTSTVYLDLEEGQSLLNAIDLIKTLSVKYEKEKLEPYTEVLYSSKGGFKFGYLNKGNGSGMFESNSALFIRTPTMESVIKNDEKRLAQIKTTIANVLYKMSSK